MFTNPLQLRCHNRSPAITRWVAAFFCLLTLNMLVGCASKPPVKPQQTESSSPKVPQSLPHPSVKPPRTHPAVKTALAQLHKPYRYGGKSPKGFDCSGLVYYAYQRNGLLIPRTSRDQLRNARRIPLAKLAPGDLLFFRQRKKQTSHVGLYVGDGRFIHASTSKQAVILSQLDNPYWKAHLITAGRY